MKTYSKALVIKKINNLLKHYSDEQISLQFAKLLLDKVNEKEEITLSPEEISKYLFNRETNKINNSVFFTLRSLGADLNGVSFDNIEIQGYYFNGFENITINLDLVPDKNLSKTCFEGVTLTGTLDNAILNYTDFKGYIGELRLNPQNAKNKSIHGSKLAGITINGSLDDIDICGVDFTDVKGDVKINPQNVPRKELLSINFSDTTLVGDYDKKTETYKEPSFDECTIYDCKFKNAKGKIIINLDTLKNTFSTKLAICDLTGVIVTGTTKSNYPQIHAVLEDGSEVFYDVKDDLFGSYYENEKHERVSIHLYQSRKWNNQTKTWEYISREDEPNLQMNVEFKQEKDKPKEKKKSIFSFFKK